MFLCRLVVNYSKKNSLLSSSELSTNDRCCDGNIQRLCRFTLWRIVWNKKFSVNLCSKLRRYTIPLISHYNHSVTREFLTIDVITIQKRGIDRVVNREMVYQLIQVSVMKLYSCNTSHRCLYYLWIPAVSCLMRTENVFNSKPICNSNDCTKITRVLHAIKG